MVLTKKTLIIAGGLLVAAVAGIFIYNKNKGDKNTEEGSENETAETLDEQKSESKQAATTKTATTKTATTKTATAKTATAAKPESRPARKAELGDKMYSTKDGIKGLERLWDGRILPDNKKTYKKGEFIGNLSGGRKIGSEMHVSITTTSGVRFFKKTDVIYK
jgi:hypothetical protein